MTLVACGIYKTPHAVYQDHPQGKRIPECPN
jgi:hypothetical protein